MHPPWLYNLLNSVRVIYRTPRPIWISEPLSSSDSTYLSTTVANSTFDTLGLQRELLDGIVNNTVIARKFTCAYGSIILLAEKEDPWQFPIDAVGRVLQIFHKEGQPFRVVFFGNRRLRLPPALGQPIQKEHINGGYTNPCDPGTIVVYRREEAIRVLIHECLHASCSDPHTTNLAETEADTEAWAELTLCALASRGKGIAFRSLFEKQVAYTLAQAAKAARDHGVRSADDYAWRYVVGKLDVWRRLGFAVPHVRERVSGRPLRSLRLTFPQLEHIL